MGMHNNPILHTFHYLPNDHGTPDPLPSVHCGSRNEEADSEADALRGHTEYIFDSPRLMQDSPPPNASAESVDWGIIPAWILGMTNPSSQEVPEDTSMFDAAPGTYPPYSVGSTLLYQFPFLIPYPRVRILTRIYRRLPPNPYVRPWVNPYFPILFDRWPARWQILVSSVSPQKWSVNQLTK